MAEVISRFTKKVDRWLQPRRKRISWNCEKQTECEREMFIDDSAFTGCCLIKVMFTKNKLVVGKYNHHRTRS